MKLFRSLIVFAGVIAFASTAAAQTATQDVSYAVNAINSISVDGGIQTLAVSSATAGSAPNSATVSVTWAITTNEANKKVTAQLDANITETDVTLTANLTAPSSGLSGGVKVLSFTSAQDVVTSIDSQNASGLALVYTLNATSASPVTTAKTRVVTYTIADGA